MDVISRYVVMVFTGAFAMRIVGFDRAMVDIGGRRSGVGIGNPGH